MTVQINELIIRAEIMKRDKKREGSDDEPTGKRLQILLKKALQEDKKKRER